jgi:gluconate 2-dehydrogenase gamma chain
MEHLAEGGSGSGGLSRRDLLKRAGFVSAVAAVPGAAIAVESAPARERESLRSLTAAEADTVEAFVERLIPSDANGPGAAEARVVRYIDRALDGELAGSRAVYSDGLAALDAFSRSRFGLDFADLDGPRQDAILTSLEQNLAPGFAGGSRAFFDLVREHALQGMFGDPLHGGNHEFAGWDLIGFPGVKLSFSAAEQQMDVTVVPAHKSTADYKLFSRRGRRRHDGH